MEDCKAAVNGITGQVKLQELIGVVIDLYEEPDIKAAY